MSKLPGLVYFITSSHGSEVRVKIGYTTGDPTNRLRNLQCGSPLPLGIFTAFEGNRDTEKMFHDTFAPCRLHGEWFEMRGKLRDFMLCLVEAAMERRPADWQLVFEAIEIAILAEAPIRDDDDPQEYLASANTQPWEWMRAALAAEDAKEATLQ